MRKVNYTFPAGGVEAGSEGKEGAGASQARLLILCHGEKASMFKSRLGLNRTGQATLGKVAAWVR